MPPFYITGPTGTGKSSVALALAGHCGGEIVNADAFQLYRGLDILTDKPSPGDLAAVPHHLYSVIDPAETFSAARFEKLARPAIDEIAARGKQPLVVGGTGLYLKALTHGLTDLPEASPELRNALEQLPLDHLVAWFQSLDPDGAAATNLANRRYVQRALEITLQTGRPMSSIKTEWAQSQSAPAFNGIILFRDRENLYRRINQRVIDMFEAGAVDEVASLPRLSLTSEKAIGVADIRGLLAGEIDRDQCIARIQQATRRFAKRQLTWFNREKGFQTVCLAPDDTPESACTRILTMFPSLHSP